MPAETGERFWRCAVGVPGQLARAALLLDNGPIGTNTLIETMQPLYGNEVGLLFSGWYDGSSPVAWRVRFTVYGINDITVPPAYYPYNRVRYHRWLALVTPFHWNVDPVYQTDVLPNYDMGDGTSHPSNLFTVPAGFVWTAGGARMMRCDGTQIVWQRDYATTIFGGSTDKQHPCPVATEDDNPVAQPTMWELEYAEFTQPTYIGQLNWHGTMMHTWKVQRFVHFFLEYYMRNQLTSPYQWEGPFYGVDLGNYLIINVFWRKPVNQWPPVHNSLAVHHIDNSSAIYGSTNVIVRRNLFSGAVINTKYIYEHHWLITRVRYMPRFGTALALARAGIDSTQFSLKLVDLQSNNVMEVLNMTATSVVMEIAEDQRLALLVYTLSDNSVYRRISYDGAVTWSEPERCQWTAGNAVSAYSVSDLDYSPRRRCWFLVLETGPHLFDVAHSEDGLRWQYYSS